MDYRTSSDFPSSQNSYHFPPLRIVVKTREYGEVVNPKHNCRRTHANAFVMDLMWGFVCKLDWDCNLEMLYLEDPSM